ncbi:hypothetical protein PFISCL1PPCAC_14669, partial [Pristionchus fissidentatus]
VMSADKEQEKIVSEKKVSSAKYEKAVLHHFDQQCKDIRNQLNEQVKALGERTETQVAVLAELEDFIRKRGEVEGEHAKNLEKLARGIIQRQKTEKTKRDSWTHHAACSVWQELVDSTRAEAEQRQSVANLLVKKIAPGVAMRADDLMRMSKKCRDIAVLSHSEMHRVMTELQTAMKTYQIVYAECAIAEKKMRSAQDELMKTETANAGKNTLSRKQKHAQKVLAKRSSKYREVRLRCTKARNEYILCVKAANASLHKFYADDLSFLIDCSDLGMDFWLQSLIGTVNDARKDLAMKEMTSLADLEGLRDSLDSRADKQSFFESRPTVFMLPKPFEFKPQMGDNEWEVCADEGLGMELSQRHAQIEKRLDGLRFESDEVWKSLEASEKQLLSLYINQDEDTGKWKNDLAVTFQYYLKKMEYYMLNGNLIERLQTRSKVIMNALGGSTPTHHLPTLVDHTRTKRRTRRIAPSINGKPTPKLFGSSLEEYCEMTGDEVPVIVTSTIGYLSRFALRHQGLFRVSGSTSEINKFKEAFERGEDVVSDLIDPSEINSVAGVLKLYLRELREPPFPLYLFDQFTACVMNTERDEKVFVQRVHDLICRLPPSSIRLLRFLFSFLSHLCEFSDENMMEPHNVAICLGPTLLPIPEGKDQVFYHNFVNELIRGMIIHHEFVFPSVDVLPGIVYDKYTMAREEPFSYAEDGEGEEDTGDEEESTTSMIEERTPRCSTDYSSTHRYSSLISPRPLLISPSPSSNHRSIIAPPSSSSPSPSPLTTLHTDTSHSSCGSVTRIALPGMTREDGRGGERGERGDGRGESTVWEMTPSSSGHPVPLFTSLRGQLHHLRREEEPKQLDARMSSLNNNSSSSPLPPLISRPSVLPPKSAELSCELNKLFRDNGSRDGQPDVVLQSVVRRSSPSLPSLSNHSPPSLPSLSHPSPSHPSPSPSPLSALSAPSPGMCIDELSAMLATLKE